MNKQIKFRGKRLDNGEWIYGSLLSIEDTYFIIEQIDFDFDYRTEASAFWFDCTEKEVDPSTIGQYTGLKDRNGMEIYEGDILHIPEIPYFKGGNGYVLFINDCISVKDGEEHEWRLTWVVQESDDGILGNIYDNPQLLNQ